MRGQILYSVLMLLIFISCKNEMPELYDHRPHSPWVFRSVLDLKPRVITFALHENLWVSYTTENGALYKAWKGLVNFDGPVYTTNHGPQPTSAGPGYFVNKYERPWIVKKNNQDLNYEYQYRGHKFTGLHATLLHEFTLAEGQKFIVEEQPEFIVSASGQLGFKRSFHCKGLPPGSSLGIKMNLSSIVAEQNIETSGQWVVTKRTPINLGKREFLELDGILSLPSDSLIDFSVFLLKTPLIPNENDPKDEIALDDPTLPLGARLIGRNDCRTCHNTRLQTIGPAYMSVAERYQNTQASIGYLVNKVKTGGSGIWGSQVMTPHPGLSDLDARVMVEYILSLVEEESSANTEETEKPLISEGREVQEESLLPGAIVELFRIPSSTTSLPPRNSLHNPFMGGIMSNFDNLSNADFKGLSNNFCLVSRGFLKIEEDQEISFRLWSDDGSRLSLNGQVMIDHDGLHGTSMKETTITMGKGYHSFVLEYFQSSGDKFLSFNWKPSNASQWAIIPPEYFFFFFEDQEFITSSSLSLPMSVVTKIPGDQMALTDVHPSFNLSQARPYDFTPKVGGMDFLSDGRLLVSTWDPEGAVYILENVDSQDPDQILVKKIASGLAEPLGLKVVDNRIFVMQKQELTELIDVDGDDLIDQYITLCDDWKVSANFHEFGFGLEHKDGFLYATLATAIVPGGASSHPQISDRGKVLKVNIESGQREFISYGLRTPNGIGLGYDGEIFVADNQGDWLPSSKIVHVSPGAWFGSRSVDFEGTANLKEKLPVVWLPQDEIGNSPSTPLSINLGPYAGQMIHGEVTHGGIKRVFVEEVNGEYQGAVFRFIQGLEAGINRLVWGPDHALYAGGIGNPGNWGQVGKRWFGLERLEYNGTSVFEMLAIRAKSNGLEIEFTEPLQESEGWNNSDYLIKQWYYQPTANYGGPKIDERELDIKSVNVSEDHRKLFLELEGMKAGHVIYVLLKNHFVSSEDHALWSTEGWYTLNSIPRQDFGFKTDGSQYRSNYNVLTDYEVEEGWKLLFDGRDLSEWRRYQRETAGKNWAIRDGAIYLNVDQNSSDGSSREENRGDLMTKKEFENFELKLEWKIQNCGNSGILFNVLESEEYELPWHTGPEMQILDNVCHPDTKYPTHRAGDLYDMIECNMVTVKPAGEWNKVILKSVNGMVQYWQNGYKVVEFQMFTDQWNERISNSKFKDMPNFGQSGKGHIVLQDHGDKVWFRNIKIKEL